MKGNIMAAEPGKGAAHRGYRGRGELGQIFSTCQKSMKLFKGKIFILPAC